MANRPITKELYEKLLAGFLDAPGNASHAARVAGCDRRMAKRGWEVGWPLTAPWAEPLNRVVARRQREAEERKLAENVEQARQAARIKDSATEEAIKVRGEEARMVAAARVDAVMLLGGLAQLGPAIQTLSQQVRRAVEANELSPKEGVNLMRAYASAVQSATRAGQTAMELNRLFNGDPTKIIGVQEVSMTEQEALLEIEASNEAKLRYQRRGLTVIGGRDDMDAASGIA